MRGMMGYDAVDPTDNDSKSCGERGKGWKPKDDIQEKQGQ